MIVDASVAAKWFLRGEAYAAEARACRAQLEAGTLALQAPDLILYEVANAIWKRTDIGPKSAARLARVATAYLLHLTVPSSPVYAAEAMTMARTLDTTFYDAAYLALAKLTRQPLLSADAELLDRAGRAHLAAIHLAKYDHRGQGTPGGSRARADLRFS